MQYKLKDYIAISGSGVLFNTQTGESYSVNELGMIVIEQLKRDRNLEQIKEYVYSEYLIDEATLEEHLEEFLSFMQQHSLIQATNAS